jgi:hypothetical protein
MVVRFLTTKLVPAATTLGVAVTVYCSNAAAFFPPILGSDPPVVVVPPPVSPVVPVVPPVIPPVVPPPFVPPPVVVPPVNPPVVPSDRCPTPSEIPEPATVATALIGLAAFGAAGVRKAMKKKDEAKA